jgi:hypothetical protein
LHLIGAAGLNHSTAPITPPFFSEPPPADGEGTAGADFSASLLFSEER